MGLIRLILLIAIGLLLYQAWKVVRARFDRPSKPPAVTSKPMVRCEHCGVHLPQDDALEQDGHWYCSQEHLPHWDGD